MGEYPHTLRQSRRVGMESPEWDWGAFARPPVQSRQVPSIGTSRNWNSLVPNCGKQSHLTEAVSKLARYKRETIYLKREMTWVARRSTWPGTWATGRAALNTKWVAPTSIYASMALAQSSAVPMAYLFSSPSGSVTFRR